MLFCRDNSPDGNANIYGTHPTYTVLEEDGNAHTVLFLNSNAQANFKTESFSRKILNSYSNSGVGFDPQSRLRVPHHRRHP